MSRSLADGLPGSTAELIKLLDETVPVPRPSVADLVTEESRGRLAIAIGQRDLVDQLRAIWKRQQQEAK